MDSFEMYTRLVFDHGCSDDDMMNELMNWLPEDVLCDFFEDYAKDRDINLLKEEDE